MKTIPTPITTGLSSNLAQFWLVKVEGSTATYYWTTQSKNLTAQSLILKDSTVTVTVDSGVIAKFIDGQPQTGISQIEFGVDISQGGGISSAADVEIDILNQDRKDTTILTAPNRLEYRPVTIYMGYIPAGASPTVEITTDLLQMWTGVVDDVLDFDYGHFRLACTDGVFLRHKDIPTTVVDETAYPYAPEENLGKPIPDVYGDFTSSDITTNVIYEKVNPCPSIMIDEPNKQFAFAGHAVHTFASSLTVNGSGIQNSFMYDGGVNIFPIFTQVITYTEAASLISQTFGTAQAVLRYYYQPKGKGVLTDADIIDHQKAVDKSSTNNTAMSVTTKPDLYFRPLKTPSNIISENVSATVTVYIDLGTVDAGFTGTMKYKKDGGALTGATTFATADSNTRVSFAPAIDTPGEYTKYQLGIASSGSDTAQIKNIVLFYDGTVNSVTEFRDVETFVEIGGPVYLWALRIGDTRRRIPFTGPQPRIPPD